VTASKKVSFKTGLPMGVHATFTHDKELWIAVPASKYQRISATIDRLIGIHSRINRDMVGWLNFYPEDGVRAAKILEMTVRAREIRDVLVREKIEAITE
jgi:hypothetical protein